MDVLANFPQLLRSGGVTINAGDGNHKFTVHEAVLSQSGSPSLQKLVEPGWRESAEGCINWTHTDFQTVERVLTWLYLHDYHSPDPIPRGSLSHSKAVTDEPEPEPAVEEAAISLEEPAANQIPDLDPSDAEDWGLQGAIFESCSIRPLTPLGRCVKVEPVMTTYKTAAGVFEEQEFPHKTFSYREPLLAHAKVYEFAKYHLLVKLQELALQRMIITLRKLDCSVNYAEQELTEVIEFVYDRIASDRHGQEPMRKLLSHFAAINYTSIMHGSFEAFIARGGDFGLDLGRNLARRLLAHGVADEVAKDESDNRIRELELQVQERDGRIRSLDASLQDALSLGRGIFGNNKKARRH